MIAWGSVAAPQGPTSCPYSHLSLDDLLLITAAATTLASGTATSSFMSWPKWGQYTAFPSSKTFPETKHEMIRFGVNFTSRACRIG